MSKNFISSISFHDHDLGVKVKVADRLFSSPEQRVLLSLYLLFVAHVDSLIGRKSPYGMWGLVFLCMLGLVGKGQGLGSCRVHLNPKVFITEFAELFFFIVVHYCSVLVLLMFYFIFPLCM